VQLVVVATGTGWPGDLATDATPVALTAADVARLAADASLEDVTAMSTVCRACPRLVAWREQVAVEKRRSYADEDYWGRPVAGFGVEDPRILVVGLAPAAHGGNRTGRVFTGDRSGDWLYAALHRAGLATKPTSTSAADGQELVDTRIVAAVRCAPPGNKPETRERDTCAHWFHRELALVSPGLRVVVVLGSFAWTATWSALRASGVDVPPKLPKFGHAVEAEVGGLTVIASFHPSQQNTFTGKLTEPMFDAVFDRAVQVAHGPVSNPTLPTT
jgi:uracil-DNA glycosylase family 4